MNGWRVRRPVSYAAETVVPFVANAAKSVCCGKLLLLGAFSALLVVLAIPILIRADMPSAGANGTLKCYDSAGNYQPCGARASAATLSPLNGRTAAAHQPVSSATTVFDQQEGWATTVVDQPADWKTNAPATRPSSASRKRPALAACGRRLIACFFAALRRKVTHLASVAAIEAGARPKYRPKDL